MLIYKYILGTVCKLISSPIILIAMFLTRRWESRFLVIPYLLPLYLLSSGIIAEPLLKTAALSTYRRKNIIGHRALILLGAGLNKQNNDITPTSIGYTRILESYCIYSIAKKIIYTITLLYPEEM